MTESKIAADVAELVRNAQAGRADALDELVTRHLPLVYNVIGRALAGHPDVDDVVQETMLRAIRGLATLREPERFRSWLVAIAYRQIQLYLRSRRSARLRRAATEPVDLADPAGDFAERATAELVVADQRRELVAAARWLDDADRRLLGLWWQEASGDLTRAELAAALEVRPKHAAVRVQRMKAQLDAARAVVRALRARPRCAELSGQTRRWNGVADPLWRKRLARHVRDCPLCATRGQGLLAPEELLLGIAALPVPAGLLTLVQAAAPVKATLLHKMLAAAAVTTVAVGGGFAYAVHHESLPPGSTPAIVAPPPARTTTPGVARTVQGRPPTEIVVTPATLRGALATVRPGQTISLRGGTYRLSAPLVIDVSGTAAARIGLSNYRGERAVIDASGVPADKWAIEQTGGFWTVRGLEVTGARGHAYVCSACHDMVFRRLSMHGNARSGLMLRDPGTTGNQVLDSDFFDNRDPAGDAGTGLSVQFGSGGGNLLRGNRSWSNGTAGFDLGGFASPVTLEYNWAFRNGGGGFVLAGSDIAAAHRLRHDAAWDNAGNGFTDDGGTAAVALTSNTAFRNGGTGFALPNAPAVLRSNAALGNRAAEQRLSPDAAASRNSWQRGWTVTGFRSTDPAEAQGPRDSGGGLPGTAFLATTNGVGASMAG